MSDGAVMKICGSKMERTDLFLRTKSFNKNLVEKLHALKTRSQKGGGEDPAKRQKERGKMLGPRTCRDI